MKIYPLIKPAQLNESQCLDVKNLEYFLESHLMKVNMAFFLKKMYRTTRMFHKNRKNFEKSFLKKIGSKGVFDALSYGRKISFDFLVKN